LLDGVVCTCLLTPLDIWCNLTLRFLCWLFCLYDLSIDESGILKSHTITVSEPNYHFMSSSFMKLYALIFCAYIFVIVIFSWYVCSFYQHVNSFCNFRLIFIWSLLLLVITIATSGFFWSPFVFNIILYPFILNLYVFAYKVCFFCLQAATSQNFFFWSNQAIAI
jgi:hypothetical protein